MSNAESPVQCVSLIPRRLSNVSFPQPGTVKGSEENVEKEEIFLCERLLDDTSRSRNDFKGTRWISWNNRIASVVQGMKRPVCGMVALCMAGQMLRRHDPCVKVYENDESILDVAKRLGFSKQGEMFSATQYAELAKEVLNCEASVLTSTLNDSWKEIFYHLSMGYPVLVPYDTDRNYEPCTKNGHKAHWAILTGFVIGQQSRFWKRTDGNTPILKVFNSVELIEILNGLNSRSHDLSLLYVYAKQGKSAKQQLWSLKRLSASNANLMEVCPSRDHSLYHIPQEGLKVTLCSQSVLLFPKSHRQAQ